MKGAGPIHMGISAFTHFANYVLRKARGQLKCRSYLSAARLYLSAAEGVLLRSRCIHHLQFASFFLLLKAQKSPGIHHTVNAGVEELE